MHKCRNANTKENLLFQERFCKSEAAMYKIAKNFKIEVEVYEELPPWHNVYNANGSDILLKDAIIMLKISDLTNRIVYYPIFSEAVAKKLLTKWDIALPEKLTVFVDSDKQTECVAGVDKDNQSLRTVIEFARLFTMIPDRSHRPMPYGFNNLYAQLHLVPEMGVAPETVRMVNSILGEFINSSEEERYIYCNNLQEFIDYLRNRYKLLKFKNSDFTSLRRMIQEHYPGDKIYF